MIEETDLRDCGILRAMEVSLKLKVIVDHRARWSEGADHRKEIDS